MKTTGAFLKAFLLLVLVTKISIHTLSAQNSPELRKREIGMRLTGINNFGLIYKYELKDNKYRRLRLVSGDINIQNTDFTNFNTGFSLAIGSEKRVPISEKAKLLHGPEFVGGFSFSAVRNTTNITLRPGAAYTLGFLYQPNEKFNISLEGAVILATTYQFVSGNRDWIDHAALSLQLNSNNLALNLVYCFESKKKTKK